MSPATKKHQQLILLEHDRAQSLDELAKRTRIPKQSLLREAVDDLLAKHSQIHSQDYDVLRRVLKEARALATKIDERGHSEMVTVNRAKKILSDLDEIQEVFDKNWRFS